MAKFASSNMLDGGLSYLKNNATKAILIKDYTVGDSYEDVTGNTVVAVTIDSSDILLTDGASSSRVATIAEQAGTVTGATGATPDLHYAFTNGSNEVIYVTNETTDREFLVDDTATMPAITVTVGQPA